MSQKRRKSLITNLEYEGELKVLQYFVNLFVLFFKLQQK